LFRLLEYDNGILMSLCCPQLKYVHLQYQRSLIHGSILIVLQIPTHLHLSTHGVKMNSARKFGYVVYRITAPPVCIDGGIIIGNKTARRMQRVKETAKSAPINPHQRPKLIIPNTRLGNHQSWHPIRLHIHDAHIPPSRMNGPIRLIIRSEEETFNGYIVTVVSVHLYRLSVGFTPNESPCAGVVVYTDSVPVQGASAGTR
jgi:hypothetical protein